MNTEPKRQKLRKLLIIISFILFPVTIFYFSPVLIVMGAANGVLAGSAMVFAAQFISALILGRAFCGWICPAGGLQEACFIAQTKRVNGRKCDWVKYLIWTPWVVTIVWLFVQKGILSPDFFFKMDNPISLSSPAQYPVYIVVTGLIFVLALTVGRRGFCHSACWMAPFMIAGLRLRALLRVPALHLRSDKKKCINCKLCTSECPMSLPVMEMVQAETMQNSECILCGNCADVCKKQVIAYAFGIERFLSNHEERTAE